MATGDQTDMQARLRQLLPSGWFAQGATPVKDALLIGVANAMAFVFGLLQYVKLQTRIATASDGFLDLVAGDFFGPTVQRGNAQTDASFRTTIIANMFRERATRRGLRLLLLQLTGREPVIFEPTRPADTGGWGIGWGYSRGGGYGSLSLPLQTFVTAFRQINTGIPFVGGYGLITIPWGATSSLPADTGTALTDGSRLVAPGWGYGVGRGEWARAADVLAAMTDLSLYAAVDSVRPAGSIVWLRLSNG